MVKSILLTVLCCALLAPFTHSLQEDETEKVIMELIPAATALTLEEFNKLTSPRAGGGPQLENQSLMFLYMECDPTSTDEEKNKEFSYVDQRKAVDPAKLAGFLAAGHHTFVREDTITDFTCDWRMESASGTVAFEVPDMIRGSFHYKATETDDGWQIDEISLPANGLVTRLQEDGKWKRSEIEKEDEDDK